MTTTGQNTTSGSFNRELFERTLRYVSSTESTQDASTRDAQDAVLDSLPPQELDPRDQPEVVPGVRRPQSQSRDSSSGGTGLFDDSGAAESRRTRRLRRACRWLKRGIIWSILWTGVGLCVMAPPYGSKEDEGQISPSETLRVAIRLLGGAWIGHVISIILGARSRRCGSRSTSPPGRRRTKSQRYERRSSPTSTSTPRRGATLLSSTSTASSSARGGYLCGDQISGAPRHRRDVFSVAVSAT